MNAAPFSKLARVYDAITCDVDYDDWCAFILETAAKVGYSGRTVLDLGCGTGNSSLPFVMRGYQVTGLDASPDMLAIARRKLPEAEFVVGSFGDFWLGRKFDLIASIFDSLNNLLEPAQFERACCCARRHLSPGGLFMFDVNTTFGLRELWEGGVVAGWAGDVHYQWEHSFDEATNLAQITAYCQDPRGRFTEVHYERPYDPDELIVLLTRAGFQWTRILAYPSGKVAAADASRVWVVAAPTPPTAVAPARVNP